MWQTHALKKRHDSTHMSRVLDYLLGRKENGLAQGGPAAKPCIPQGNVDSVLGNLWSPRLTVKRFYSHRPRY